jgi:DNA-binding NarL/FixJ family response regulator
MAMKILKQSLKQKSKVFIVDDHPIVRYGITRILNNEPDFTVCGDSESAEKALSAIENLRPDFIIVDISLKDMDGLQLTRIIRERHPKMPIVILSMHDERIYAHKALRAGANGYIMKEESSEKLVTAIRQILQGDIFVSEQVQKNVLHAYASKEKAREIPSINKLSDREREIFLLVGAGHTSRSIADKLNLSVKTIETHRLRIKQKFGLNGSEKLTQAAVEWAKRENLVSVLT